MAKKKNPRARVGDAMPCGKVHAIPREACSECVRVLNALLALRASHRPGKSSRATCSAHLEPQRTHDRRRGLPAGGRDGAE